MTKQDELLDRLRRFAISYVKLIKALPKTEENNIYGRQAIRSSSSIGANYSEATCSHTKADFVHDLNKCRKEAKETVYWTELILAVNPNSSNEITLLLQESKEIYRIFMSSVKTTLTNMKSQSKENNR